MKGSLALCISVCFFCQGLVPLSAQPPAKVDTISASVITADNDRPMISGLTTLDETKIRSGLSALGVSDVLRTLKSLSGVASGMEISSGLYVHGGDGSDNLFLLDGVPLFQVAHLGGMYSSFNTDAIQSLDFYKSGFPPRYGGRLSSVVDFCSKMGDDQSQHGIFSLGLLDGHLAIGGPIIKNKLSYFAGLRRSWADLVTTPYFIINNSRGGKQESWSYHMHDLNLGLTWTPNLNDRFSVRLYQGRDRARYAMSVENKLYGKEVFRVKDSQKLNMAWGNLAVSSEWKHSFSEHAPLQVLIYYSRGSSNLYNGSTEHRIEDNDLVKHSVSEQTSGDIALVGASIRQALYLNRHRLGFGADFHNTGYLNPDIRYYANGAGLYAEDKYCLDALQVLFGIRMDAYRYDGGVYFKPQPRAMVSYKVGNRLSLNSSFTHTVQFDHLLCSVFLDLPTNRWAPSSKELPPSEANQIAIGWDYNPSSRLGINGELYYKSMDNLVMYKGESTLFPPSDNGNNDFVCGKGRAYGMDLEGHYRTPRFETSIYYTLSWTERYYPDLYPYWFYDRFDNRHKITIKHNHQINRRVSVNVSWEYHTGNRVTLPEQVVDVDGVGIRFLYSSPYNMKMPDWHCLNLGCQVRRETKKGHDVFWTFGLYNAYARKNPIMIRLIDSEDKPGEFYLIGYSLPPFIPSVSYTIKF